MATTTDESGGDCLPAGALEAIAQINEQTQTSLVDFFRHEVSLGNLPKGTSPEDLANYMLAMQYGLGVMARNGAKRETLDRVIEYAVTKI